MIGQDDKGWSELTMIFKKRRFRSPRISTVIGRGTEIEGSVRFTDGLHVDGVVKGDVISDPEDERATLTLSDHGRIQGNVKVANAMLNGTVIGDVIASHRVELAPQARITGTVTYALLEMAMGAEVNGKLIHAEELETPSQVFGEDSLSVEPRT
jgi:cytoskeletal protein CcmA (bactofilin family)